MSKRIKKLIEKSNYSDREFNALLSIYKYRCLSFDQIYLLHYSKSKLGTRDVDTGYMRRRMAQFKKDKLIEKMPKVEKSCPPLFTLTTDGIKVVRTYFDMSSETEHDNGEIFATDLSYNEIKIEPQFSFHQFYLNCFAINMNRLFSTVKGFQYVDERHMTKSEYIRPDGLCIASERDVVIDNKTIHMPETHFFIENDMGTEPMPRIRQKFERYRSFLLSSKIKDDVRVVILFICKDNKLNPNDLVNSDTLKNYQESSGVRKRIRNVKNAIGEAMLDIVHDNIEIFVGTQPKLLAALKLLYLPEYLSINHKTLLPNVGNILCGYNCKDIELKEIDKLTKYTNNVKYDYYAKSDKYQKSFIFLEYFGDPISVLHKITYHKKNTVSFKQAMNRELYLVIIANKEENLISLNNTCELSNPQYDNVLCTTVNRLKMYPFNKAIFKFTSYGAAIFNEDMSEMIPDPTILPNNHGLL